MKKSWFRETQILRVLKQAEARQTTAEVCRTHGISESTCYNQKAKFGRMEAANIKRLREMEEENRRPKHIYAEMSLNHQILKKIVEKG